MKKTLKIALAQLNFHLGNTEFNTFKMLSCARRAHEQQADVIVYPEFSLTGYPPEDLLLRSSFHEQVEEHLSALKTEFPQELLAIVGHPTRTSKDLRNSASIFHQRKILARYDKQHLPNYSVFDEKRYFKSGTKSCVVTLHGVRLGVVICEDLWHPGPVEQAVSDGAQIILSLNASPFHGNKPEERIAVVGERVKHNHIPIVYVNCVAGQDELVFDGGSFVLDGNNQLRHQAPLYREDLSMVSIDIQNPSKILGGTITPFPPRIESIYNALVLGTRDYLEKNRMPGALIGLSGGIDSALTLAIAVDAVGKERVTAVMMPSRHTSQMSLEDARQTAQNFGVAYHEISIEPTFEILVRELTEHLGHALDDLTIQNLQSRIRGNLLMALSNQTGKMVLTTGNKSEMAMGYATLYGDMAGGFAVLKDVLKTDVFELARYRNTINSFIPERVITRAPSAELAPNQTDQDTLPPYDLLDQIISYYMEQDESSQNIAKLCHADETLVKQVIRKIEQSEYKRRQSPPGIRTSRRAFGRDWRYPITMG